MGTLLHGSEREKQVQLEALRLEAFIMSKKFPRNLEKCGAYCRYRYIFKLACVGHLGGATFLKGICNHESCYHHVVPCSSS